MENSLRISAIDTKELSFTYSCKTNRLKYAVADLYGRIVLEGSLVHLKEYSINISSLSPGNYYLHLIDGEKVSKTRIVKP